MANNIQYTSLGIFTLEYRVTSVEGVCARNKLEKLSPGAMLIYYIDISHVHIIITLVDWGFSGYI